MHTFKEMYVNIENIYYVYIWYIKDTGEIFYVGKGKNKRYKQLTKRNKFFTDMYNSHNCDVKLIYENLSEQEAFKKEVETIAWIRENTNYRLTNQTDGGEGCSGYSPTEEVKQKMSIANKTLWENEEFRNKMMKMKQDENGVYKSKEFREKISSIVKGENNPNYGNYWTQEQKDNLSNKRKLNGKSKGVNNPMATKIICLEDGMIFDYIEDAAKFYNVKSASSFSIALHDEVRTAAGLHWKVYSEELENKEIRINELIRILAKAKNKRSIICIDDKQIFFNKKDFLKQFNISVKSLNKEMNNNQKIKINNKTYMYIDQYCNSPIC